MVRELFLPIETPEPPKASFFQGLFGGGVRQLDREELCKLIFFSFILRGVKCLSKTVNRIDTCSSCDEVVP